MAADENVQNGQAQEEAEAEAAKYQALREAFAAYLGCEPGAISGYVAAVEWATPEGAANLSSVWMQLPIWHLLGLVDELRRHIDGKRPGGVPPELLRMVGEAPPEA